MKAENIDTEKEEMNITNEEHSDIRELRKIVQTDEKAIEAIKRFAHEDDEDETEHISLKSILGGDFLGSRFIMNQILFIVTLAILSIIYTANRYDSQQDAVIIDSLRKELVDVKYNVMTQSSELLNLTRQSNIEKKLKTTRDSILTNPVTPPYLIRKDGVKEKPLPQAEPDDPNLPTGDEV